MSISSALRKLYTRFNYLRTVPVYLCVKHSPHRQLIEMDLYRWWEICIGSMTEMGESDKIDKKHELAAWNWLLLNKMEFRSLLQHRLRKPPKSIVSVLHFAVSRILWKPLDSLYIDCNEIGGGLFIQHGFATIISAQRIGENCWINQQVTIGYSGLDCPVLEDNVTVHCGAKVIGGITMHRNSTAGAGAVVVKDVPENAVVVGVPAKILKYKAQ